MYQRAKPVIIDPWSLEKSDVSWIT